MNASTGPETAGAPGPFKTLAALRAAHTELLQAYHALVDAVDLPPPFAEQVTAFLARGRATGALLDLEEDRADAQVLLNYWTTVLYDSGIVVRAALLDTLTEHHVRTLRAYGVSEWRIVSIYALKLAFVPVVSILGIGFGDLIGSSVVAEIIFARPGLGSLIFNSISQRNYPVVQACVVFIVGFYIIANLVVDLINAMLDPRIAKSMQSGGG